MKPRPPPLAAGSGVSFPGPSTRSARLWPVPDSAAKFAAHYSRYRHHPSTILAAVAQKMLSKEAVGRVIAVIMKQCAPEPYVEGSRPCPGSEGLEDSAVEAEAGPAAGPAGPAAVSAGGVAAAPEAGVAPLEGGGLAGSGTLPGPAAASGVPMGGAPALGVPTVDPPALEVPGPLLGSVMLGLLLGVVVLEVMLGSLVPGLLLGSAVLEVLLGFVVLGLLLGSVVLEVLLGSSVPGLLLGSAVPELLLESVVLGLLLGSVVPALLLESVELRLSLISVNTVPGVLLGSVVLGLLLESFVPGLLLGYVVPELLLGSIVPGLLLGSAVLGCRVGSLALPHCGTLLGAELQPRLLQVCTRTPHCQQPSLVIISARHCLVMIPQDTQVPTFPLQTTCPALHATHAYRLTQTAHTSPMRKHRVTGSMSSRLL